jgi:hypothetical protein
MIFEAKCQNIVNKNAWKKLLIFSNSKPRVLERVQLVIFRREERSLHQRRL